MPTQLLARVAIFFKGKKLSFLVILFIGIVILPAFSIAQINERIKQEVPVLCYHQVRHYTPADGREARGITVTPENFTAQMKMLADKGFQTILPNDLYAFYTTGKALPPKPVIISFDDNTASQFIQALPVLNRYHFKAVFFVMTVSIGKSNYLSEAQLRQLYKEGHEIGAHTWDHKNVKKYTAADWKTQLDRPLKTLENITGKPIRYFAFPYGSWHKEAILQLESRDIRMAFILHTSNDANKPLFTIRRLMVLGSWSAETLLKMMNATFHSK